MVDSNGFPKKDDGIIGGGGSGRSTVSSCTPLKVEYRTELIRCSVVGWLKNIGLWGGSWGGGEGSTTIDVAVVSCNSGGGHFVRYEAHL